MPAATEQPAAKKEREELLWQSLKEHIMRERQKLKEEQEAEVEEERLRKEREERDRQDAMTLGETKEQIQILNTRLEELRNEKQQLFLRLKKVLNEDENRKKQQQQKDSEMFALQSIVQQQGSHPQIFLPPRAPHQQLMQKYLQSGPPPMSGIPTPPNKRVRSPSPTPQGFYKTSNAPYSQSSKHEDGRRGGEVARTVLWTKPTYQNPPGTLYYPSNSQDSRDPAFAPNLNIPLISSYHSELSQQQSQHSGYAPNLNIPLISSYHQELSQQQSQSQSISSEQQSQQQQQSQQAPTSQQQSSQPSNQPHDSKAKLQQNAQVYQVNLDQPSLSQQQQQSSHGQQHKSHPQQISLEKLNERNYHLEKQQQAAQPASQQSNHLPPDGMYRMPMSLPSGMLISSQNSQIQGMKPVNTHPSNQRPTSAALQQQSLSQQQQQQQQQQQGQMPPIHYRHRY